MTKTGKLYIVAAIVWLIAAILTKKYWNIAFVVLFISLAMNEKKKINKDN